MFSTLNGFTFTFGFTLFFLTGLDIMSLGLPSHLSGWEYLRVFTFIGFLQSPHSVICFATSVIFTLEGLGFCGSAVISSWDSLGSSGSGVSSALTISDASSPVYNILYIFYSFSIHILIMKEQRKSNIYII